MGNQISKENKEKWMVFEKLSKDGVNLMLSDCKNIDGLKPFSLKTLAALMFIHKNTKAEESGILYMDLETVRKVAGVKMTNLYLAIEELGKRGIIDYERGAKREKGASSKASSFTIHFDTLGKEEGKVGKGSKHWEGKEETPQGKVEGKEASAQKGKESELGKVENTSKYWEGKDVQPSEGKVSEGKALHYTTQHCTADFLHRLNYLLDLLKLSPTCKGWGDNILNNKSSNNFNEILEKIIQQVMRTREENLTLREELAKVKLENMEMKQQLCEARQQPSLQSEEEDSPTLAMLTPELRANTELMKTIRMFDKDAASRRRDESMQTPVCDEDYEEEQW